jgi:CheY-like chemotaxis protein
MRKPRPRQPAIEPHVVLIDDQRDHLAYMTTLLRRLRYSVVAFSSAREALAYIDRSEVDLVIADVLMPDMDGFELLRVILRRPRPLPVVTLSGGDRHGGDDFFLRCTQRLGAVATLRKPLDVDTLITVLDCWVPLERGAPGKSTATNEAMSQDPNACDAEDQ